MLRAPEEWRPIPGYGGRYDVSSRGRIRSWLRQAGAGVRRRPIILASTAAGRRGEYRTFQACVEGKKSTVFIHRAAALAFIGPPPTPEHEVAHEDGVGHHNDWTNLAWKTSSENKMDKHRHGTMPIGSKHHAAKLTETQALRALNEVETSGGEMAKELGVHPSTINRIRSGEKWPHLQSVGRVR